ncbi:MFS transporter, partial [Gordonia phosphorivorans]
MQSPPIVRRGLLQPWFAGYMLVGLVVSGIVPILIPLSMDTRGEYAVGAVVAAFYLGTLAAPLFGSLADRTGTQRAVFIGSFPAIAAATAAFGLLDGTAAR